MRLGTFNQVRHKAGVVHIDGDTGARRKKHPHAVRGTFAIKPMTEADLTNQELADLMGWAPDKVAQIRRVYVDQSSVVMAIGKRIARSRVNRAVNRRDAEA